MDIQGSLDLQCFFEGFFGLLEIHRAILFSGYVGRV